MFIQLNIVDFYPSIIKDLFKAALDFANETGHICAETREIFSNARQLSFFTLMCMEKLSPVFLM